MEFVCKNCDCFERRFVKIENQNTSCCVKVIFHLISTSVKLQENFKIRQAEVYQFLKRGCISKRAEEINVRPVFIETSLKKSSVFSV